MPSQHGPTAEQSQNSRGAGAQLRGAGNAAPNCSRLFPSLHVLLLEVMSPSHLPSGSPSRTVPRPCEVSCILSQWVPPSQAACPIPPWSAGIPQVPLQSRVSSRSPCGVEPCRGSPVSLARPFAEPGVQEVILWCGAFPGIPGVPDTSLCRSGCPAGHPAVRSLPGDPHCPTRERCWFLPSHPSWDTWGRPLSLPGSGG